MTALTTSWDVLSGDESSLAVNITTTQTTLIKVSTMNINGVSTTAWSNTSGVMEVEQDVDGTKKMEWIAYGSVTVNSDNTVTLGDVSRDVSRTGSSLTGSGTGQRFNKGAKCRQVLHHFLINKKANIDRANSWTAVQTLGTGSSLTPTNTTTPVYHGQSLTTTQRDALTGVANGDWIYNSTAGQTQWREGGTWVTNAAGSSVADMSATVAGKAEEATVAEQAAHTATGGTGARLVPAVANLVTLAADGTWIAGAIPTLNTSKYLDTSLLGSGSPTASNYLLGNGTWGTTGTVPNVLNKYTNSADSNDITSGTGYAAVDYNTSYTIPAGNLTAGVVYEMVAEGYASTSTDLGGTWYVKLGSTIMTFGAVTVTSAGGNCPWRMTFRLMCVSTGVSGTVHTSGSFRAFTAAGALLAGETSLCPSTTSTVDTTGTLALNPQFGWQSELYTRHSKVKIITINRIG